VTFLTGRHLSRRSFVRGAGASVALPFLDAMVPAGRGSSRIPEATRLVAIEIVHGAAGSSAAGAERHLWAPPQLGRDFDLSLGALAPLEPFRDQLTIISNTDVRMAEAYGAREVGGDHFRSSAVFLTQAHPRQIESSDVFVGTSLDQLYARRFGQDTPIPSMQLCIENVDQAGGCGYGYSCVYTDTLSWASPTEPLPMVRDPSSAFDQLFGVGGTPEARAERRRAQRSILDWIAEDVARLMRGLRSADRERMGQYLENIRELERRIERVEAQNASGEPREIPDAPRGVPDSFTEHVHLMMDLQVLAFQADMTRVFAFKLARDATGRVYAESGSPTPFHPASHHGGHLAGILDFALINRFHVGMLTRLLEQLAAVDEGGSSLLDKSMIIYGSPMADGNLHNHRRCPLIVLGHANGRLRGGEHVKAPDGTPMANALLALLHKLGMDDLARFGDSTGALALDQPMLEALP
jgi:hypothetical protein